MQNFNLDLSYAVISAIRSGLNPHFSEEEKIGYDVDIADFVFQATDGYELLKTIRFIETSINRINSGK